MTTLFPPVLESRAVAIPFSEPLSIDGKDYTYNIDFFIPEINGPVATAESAIGIKHIQVILRYKTTGESAVNPNYSPDNNTLFIPTNIPWYVNYDPNTRFCSLKLPYRLFKNRHPEKGINYTVQIRFGANELWEAAGSDPFASNKTDFSGFNSWRMLQTSTVPSGFGEWSNIQTVYCYGDAKTSLTYNLNDFVPELFYEYAPEDNDPLEQCKIVYNYNSINGSVMKSLVFNGVAQSDGSYTLRVKLPIAPVQIIKISLEAITVNGTVRGKTLNIPPIAENGGLISIADPSTNFEDGILRGEELEDGVIAKTLQIPGAYFDKSDTISIYRSNVFTFDTIKIKDNIPLSGITNFNFKDFSVEMGEDYQYIAILKSGSDIKQFIPIYPWGFDNSGYGRLMDLNSVFLADNNHQLRIQGNVNISSFKRNTTDQFQNTIGSKYPFYSRSAETNYRSFQLSGVISINMDPTSSFLKNDQVDGLRWEDENGSRLLILNRDLYGDFEYSMSKVRIGKNNLTRHEIIEYGLEDEESVRGPSSIYDSYYARDHQSKIAPVRSDEMVFMERKFRECVMDWLSNGKPKLFRSETEGNMIVIPSAISFTPLEKTGRIVYTVTMTLTEIAELNLENLLDYNLMPINILTHTLKGFPVELHIGDVISTKDYLALINIYPEVKDCFERFEDGYQVLEENGLQDALDSINDYTFLRGNPQTPIYDKLIFIPSTDFNIGHLSISDIEVKGWKGPIFKNGVYYANGEEHSLTFEYVSSTSGKKSLPDGFDFDNKNGQLSVAIGTKLKPSSPVRMTFKVYDELGEANSEYFTISMGAVYEDLTIKGVKIDAKTTRDDIILPLQVSGGVKFKDVSGSLEDADYIFIAENLPYGLTLEPNGTIVGRIAGKQLAGSFDVTVKDALNKSATAKISFDDIFYWPYINDMDYFNIGYVEVGREISPIDLTSAVVGGSGDFDFLLDTEKEDKKTLLPGIKIKYDADNKKYYVGGILTEIPKEYLKSFKIDLYDKKISIKEPAASLTLTLSQILSKFVFEDNSTNKVLSEIKGPISTEGAIPIGEVLSPINILDYYENEEKITFVNGGLPFYDGEGKPYYKFSAENFYPDYNVTIKGILSGRAIVGAEERKATIYTMDARGIKIPLNGEKETTIIRQIISKMQIIKTFEPEELTIGRFVEGPNTEENPYGEIKIPIDAFSGGYIASGKGYTASQIENPAWPEWLAIRQPTESDPFITIYQKAGSIRTVSRGAVYKVKISDNGNPDETQGEVTQQSVNISFTIGDIIPIMKFDDDKPMAFVPPLQIGTFSTASLPKIIGGIAPYTFSTYDWQETDPDYFNIENGLDGTDFRLYQGQGAEQDPNKFYVGGTPTTNDPVNTALYIIDGIGQKLKISFSSGGAVNALDFITLNSLEDKALLRKNPDLNYNLPASNLPSIGIIKGVNGFPFEEGNAYNFSFKDKTGQEIDFDFGFKFRAPNKNEERDTWYLYGTPNSVQLESTSYQQEFKITDGSGVSKTFSDGKIRHIWKSPKIYDQTLPNGKINIDLMKEGEGFVSSSIFKSGIGIAQHPQAKYYYSWTDQDNFNWDSAILLEDKKELIYNGKNTNIFWIEGNTTLQSTAVKKFTSDKFTLTIGVKIEKDKIEEYNYLSDDYAITNTITFEGITETFCWRYFSFNSNIEYSSVVKTDKDPKDFPIKEKVLYLRPSLEPEEAYIFNKNKDGSFNLELISTVQKATEITLNVPVQTTDLKEQNSQAIDYTWNTDLKVLQSPRLFAEIINGFGNYQGMWDGNIPQNWELIGQNNLKVQHTYISSEGVPEMDVVTVPIKIVDYFEESLDTISSSVNLKIIWNGVMLGLKVTQSPNLSEEYDLNDGLIRDMSNDTKYGVNVLGGSGKQSNYRYEIKDSKDLDANNLAPYGLPGTGLITTENIYKTSEERIDIDMGTQSRMPGTYYLYVWDTKVDPGKTSPVMITGDVGAIKGGLPFYKKDIIIPKDEVETDIYFELKLEEYFFGSNAFTLTPEGEGYNTWIANEGQIELLISEDKDKLIIQGKRPKINVGKQNFNIRIVSQEEKIAGESTFINIVAEEQIPPPEQIYGVYWDGTSTTKWERTDRAKSFEDTPPIPYYNGITTESYSPFDNISPWKDMTVVEDPIAGSLVQIPKFYYKLIQEKTGIKIQISNDPVEGFSVSPAHMDRGDGQGERDVVYIGRYHCAKDTFKSISGLMPQANKTRSMFRTNIHNLGEDIWQVDFAMRFTIWLLYIVEFADWNSQAVIGYGCGNGVSSDIMGYTDSMPYHTGTTKASKTEYGCSTQYRNIEGLWDNVIDYLDGCYYNNYGLNIILNPNDFSDTSNGIFIGKPLNGFPSKFAINSAAGFSLIYPIANGGSEITYSCDSWAYQGMNHCLAIGGYYMQNLMRGILGISNAPENYTGQEYGSRLMKLPNKKEE